jgi:hypothetical protein
MNEKPQLPPTALRQMIRTRRDRLTRSSPQKIIAQGTDRRFLKELKG